MKRVIETKNLALNHMINICDLCKRCEGFRKDNDDIYKCRYNKEKRGLYNGPVMDHPEVFKCKYYKRNTKYQTCKLESKDRTTYSNGKITKVQYKRGKFVVTITRKENKNGSSNNI